MKKSAKADIWMPLYIADYLRDTLHLTREQHGGYLLLLMACWARGGSLPTDAAQLAGIAKATPREWAKLAPVLLPFFRTEGDRLVHGRVQAEHEKAARLSEARRETGKKGGRPRKQIESEPKAIGLRNHNQNETPARVVVVVDRSELVPLPSQELDSSSSEVEVISLAERAAR